MSALDFLDEELALLEQQHRRRIPRVVGGAQGVHPIVDGRQVVSFSSNDYLGLAAHPAVAVAAQEAIVRYGVGAGSSRLIVGNSEPHVALEQSAAAWLGVPAARLFNSGYAANVGVVQVFGGEGVAIFSDSRNHASLIDGCRLSRSHVKIFKNLNELAGQLEGAATLKRRVIVTESVSSMDGDVMDLVAIRTLADAHEAILLVDEAHAVGVFGTEGQGVLASSGVSADSRIATFGKALGTAGAVAAGSWSLVDVLWNRARMLVFTTGLPPAIAAATTAAIGLVRGEEGRRRRVILWRQIERLAKELRDLGFRCSGATPILPIVLGSDEEAMRWTCTLWERGVYVQGIRPPTVPEGTARLRIAVSADHSDDDVSQLLDGLKALTVSRGTRA